jgi:putative endonuclease
MKKIGEFGEELVAQWLESEDWEVLQRRWHSPWGEIDIIAKGKKEEMLIFVEVKTRSPGNWDGGGMDAIARRKQEKILLTAQTFLSQHPHLALLPCRFDVALVSRRKISPTDVSPLLTLSLSREGYQYVLETYLESAFT